MFEALSDNKPTEIIYGVQHAESVVLLTQGISIYIGLAVVR